MRYCPQQRTTGVDSDLLHSRRYHVTGAYQMLKTQLMFTYHITTIQGRGDSQSSCVIITGQ